MSTVNTVYIVAADYGAYDGWQRPIGVFYSEERAFAAIGRAMIEGLWCAQNLRIVPLEIDGPLAAEDPARRTLDQNRGGEDV